MAASAAAVAFLLWLLYFHDAPATLAQRWIFLPQLNALLNGLSAVALCVGLYFIKRKNWRAHRASMLAAFGSLRNGRDLADQEPAWDSNRVSDANALILGGLADEATFLAAALRGTSCES